MERPEFYMTLAFGLCKSFAPSPAQSDRNLAPIVRGAESFEVIVEFAYAIMYLRVIVALLKPVILATFPPVLNIRNQYVILVSKSFNLHRVQSLLYKLYGIVYFSPIIYVVL